ncbi:ABC transporter substrate-binding protein [Nocardiopsis nanhaiensis]
MSPAQLPRRRFIGLALAAGTGSAVLTSTSGCAAGSGGFTGDIAITHLDATIHSAPLTIAEELGLFEEADLDLDLVGFSGGTDTVRGILSGMHFGMPSTLGGLAAVQQGNQQLKLIGGAFNEPDVEFLVPYDSDIQAIEDLRGKRIAVSQPGSISDYFAHRVVTDLGMVVGEDVEIVQVGSSPESWTTTSQGVVDATWSSQPLAENLIDQSHARMLFRTADYIDDWVDTSFWATEEFIDNHADIIRGIFQVHRDAVTALDQDPDGCAELFAQRTQLPLEVARSTLEQTRPAFSLEIDRAGIEENVVAGSELGQLDPDQIDLDDIIVDEFST